MIAMSNGKEKLHQSFFIILLRLIIQFRSHHYHKLRIVKIIITSSNALTIPGSSANAA